MLNALAEVRISDGRGNNQIHGSPEEMLQRLLEAKKGGCICARGHRLELHEEIEIAALSIESAIQGGAEELQPPDVELAAKLHDFGLLCGNCGFHGSVPSSQHRGSPYRGRQRLREPGQSLAKLPADAASGIQIASFTMIPRFDLSVRFVAMDDKFGIGSAAELVQVHAHALAVGIHAEGDDEVE